MSCFIAHQDYRELLPAGELAFSYIMPNQVMSMPRVAM